MSYYPVLFIFPIAVAFAGAMDLLTFSIPNRVSIALMIGFIVSAFMAGLSVQAILSYLAAGFIVLLVGLFMFACGWFGGGDAKLMAASALWLGFEHLVPFLAWTAILGGALSMVVLTYRRFTPPLVFLRQPWAMRLHDPKEGIPYGIAIAGAGLMVYPQTFWMTALAG